MGVELHWRLIHQGRCLAAFRHERDARGFAKARYPQSQILAGSQQSWILSCIDGIPITQADLAAASGIAQRQVGAYLSVLIKQGLVRITGKTEEHSRTKDGRKGRRANLYGLTQAGIRKVEEHEAAEEG